MYRLVSSQTDSELPPNLPGEIATFGIVIGLSLLGFVAVIVVGYYLPVTSAKSYWFVSRSSGVVAYGLLTLGVLFGLLQSGNLFRSRIPPVLALGMHSYLNWFGLGLAGLHGVILIGDGYINIDFARVVMPFTSSYRPIPVGLGIVGFYLMLLLTLSFYARNHLGQKNFRLLHYTSFVVFVMVTLHSLLAGTDSVPLAWFYGTSGVAVTLLTAARILNTRQATKPKLASSVAGNRAATAEIAARRAGARRAAPDQSRPTTRGKH